MSYLINCCSRYTEATTSSFVLFCSVFGIIFKMSSDYYLILSLFHSLRLIIKTPSTLRTALLLNIFFWPFYLLVSCEFFFFCIFRYYLWRVLFNSSFDLLTISIILVRDISIISPYIPWPTLFLNIGPYH